MKSSGTGGPCTKNSCRRVPPSEGARIGFSCLNFPDVGDELIKRFSPSVVEAHILMSFTAFFVSVHRESGIFCPASLRLERDDRRKGERVGSLARRTVAGGKGDRPHELLILDDFEIAADVREVLSFGRTHYKAKHAARAQIYPAIHRRPRCRREPFLDVLRHGPRGPDELRRNIDDAFQKQVEAGGGGGVGGGSSCLLHV